MHRGFGGVWFARAEHPGRVGQSSHGGAKKGHFPWSACVAPHVIETENKIVPTTDYQVATKKMKHFNKKLKVTVLSHIRMISYEYEYFG